MDQVMERKTTTIRTLLETMKNYMDDNRHSRDVNERWLSDYLIPIWKTVAEVGNARLTEANSGAVDSFRADELREQIRIKKSEAQRLEEELKKLKAA